MSDVDFELLYADTVQAIQGGGTVAVLGLTHWTDSLVTRLRAGGLDSALVGLFLANRIVVTNIRTADLSALQAGGYSHVVVCANDTKEDLILEALPHIVGAPKVIVSGYGHYRFRDTVFEGELARLLVPSLANGYPNTLCHIYQCLANAARLGLEGVVAEFGMFKGGTTTLMANLIERLGAKWKVIGFDTFDGFPPRRSPLDMYDHEGCVFRDLASVRRYVEGRNIEIVPGDIVHTCQRLVDEDLVLSFIDTDNFTPASAAIEICKERTVISGAIVFDHFTGVDRFRYTLGERIAASSLLADGRYFNLHGTGVFYRQR